VAEQVATQTLLAAVAGVPATVSEALRLANRVPSTESAMVRVAPALSLEGQIRQREMRRQIEA
jgi:hypothetical protein